MPTYIRLGDQLINTAHIVAVDLCVKDNTQIGKTFAMLWCNGVQFQYAGPRVDALRDYFTGTKEFLTSGYPGVGSVIDLNIPPVEIAPARPNLALVHSFNNR